ncbi:HEAT repeat domain-containing protein [Microseira wollei]|uniref:HEAT repeat-containing PBS lyase n=1 Tax=Microseira wollei NIES-4236 TaxID=2530354 RepID=A0AAV3XJG1_9CYAN|nr:HEAT repeat domain-containing protein [Microseira wollei]GET41728.1 HEAT repeat-containing PBS lyase [Microseira wollei NIES-4236]
MSNSLKFETQSGENPVPLSHAETDALLASVKEQLDLETFDPDNHQLLKQMVECLGDTRGLVRLSFAQTLGEIGEPATPFLLEALANHPNVVVRRASAKTLTLLADPKTVPNLVHAFLNDEDTVVQGSAVGALARTGEAAVPVLLEILASPENSEATKGHAAWALAFIGAEAKEYIYPAIASDSPEVRSAVVGAIAKVAQESPEPQAFNLLVNALTDSDANVRCEAAAVLGNLGYQPAIPNLAQLLHHADGETRKAAALALMKVGDPSAIEPLQAALSEESETVLQQVLKLAITQLERKTEEDDW